MPNEKFSPAKTSKWTPGAAAMALTKDEKIPCRLCKKPTSFLGTKLCNRCWELETRIRNDPELALKILEDILSKRFSDFLTGT